jgi:hypothetical protein
LAKTGCESQEMDERLGQNRERSELEEAADKGIPPGKHLTKKQGPHHNLASSSD